MTPKKFILWAGAILIILAIVGFVVPRIGGDYLFFDAAENWTHLVLGIIALSASYWLPTGGQKGLSVVIGIVALYFALAGFLVAGRPPPNYFGVTNLENPLDNLVHLVVGIWALWASFSSKK